MRQSHKSPAPVHIRRKPLGKRIYEHRYLYLLLSLTLIFFVVFKYMPMYGVQLAFKKFTYRRGITGSQWIGLSNFEALFRNKQFTRTIGNTLAISIGRLVFTFFIPILMAILLNEIRCSAFKRVAQTLMYLPHFLSWVIISGIAYSLLSINGGFINKLILAAGGKPVNFLLRPDCFRPILYISGIWKEVGWESIIYLAALAGVNPELYEAATVDGAGALTRFMRITVPMISPTTFYLLIVRLIAAFKAFSALNIMGVSKTAPSLVTEIYANAFESYKFGYASAEAWVLVAVILAITLVQMVGQKKWVHY